MCIILGLVFVLWVDVVLWSDGWVLGNCCSWVLVFLCCFFWVWCWVIWLLWVMCIRSVLNSLWLSSRMKLRIFGIVMRWNRIWRRMCILSFLVLLWRRRFGRMWSFWRVFRSWRWWSFCWEVRSLLLKSVLRRGWLMWCLWGLKMFSCGSSCFWCWDCMVVFLFFGRFLSLMRRCRGDFGIFLSSFSLGFGVISRGFILLKSLLMYSRCLVING